MVLRYFEVQTGQKSKYNKKFRMVLSIDLEFTDVEHVSKMDCSAGLHYILQSINQSLTIPNPDTERRSAITHESDEHRGINDDPI